MASIERMTITVPEEMATAIKSAVDEGDYASTSEVVRDALRDWKTKRLERTRALLDLRSDIGKGLADAKAGRIRTFNADRIVAQGRKLLARR